MKQISGTAVVVESINEKACPRFSSKKGAPAPSFGGDHVCLSVIGRMFSFGSHRQPSGAKAPFFFMRLCGAPEGAPLQTSGALRWLPARPFKAQVHYARCPRAPSKLRCITLVARAPLQSSGAIRSLAAAPLQSSGAANSLPAVQRVDRLSRFQCSPLPLLHHLHEIFEQVM